MPIIEEIEEIPENISPTPTTSRRGTGHADGRTPPPVPPMSNLNQKPLRNSGPRKVLFVCLKWVIMAFVLAIFLVFIGFAALVLLHFLVTSTAVQRRRRRRRRRDAHAQSFHNSFAHVSSALSIRGLLPCVDYSATEQTRRDCAICLEAFKEGDLCRKLPDCTHLFHANCVDFWLTKKPNCPVCRTRVQLVWGPSGSMNSDDEWKFWWPVGA